MQKRRISFRWEPNKNGVEIRCIDLHSEEEAFALATEEAFAFATARMDNWVLKEILLRDRDAEVKAIISLTKRLAHTANFSVKIRNVFSLRQHEIIEIINNNNGLRTSLYGHFCSSDFEELFPSLLEDSNPEHYLNIYINKTGKNKQ